MQKNNKQTPYICSRNISHEFSIQDEQIHYSTQIEIFKSNPLVLNFGNATISSTHSISNQAEPVPVRVPLEHSTT